MKKFKEVAHLYLGCDVMIFTNSENPAIKPKKLKLCAYTVNNHSHISLSALLQLSDGKPLLIPLSKMTQNQRKDLGISWDDTEIFFNSYKPNQFISLLEAGFDLFDLINNGEAIDKTISNNH